jgi:hypothetical protein
MAFEPPKDDSPQAKDISEVKKPDFRVQYEVNGEQVDLRLMDVELLFFDLEKYNSQFSMGAMLGRVVKNAMSMGDEPEPEIEATVREEETSQQANAFFLAGTHKDTLSNLGLSIEPIAGGASLAFNGESANSGQIRFNVSRNEALTGFLGALTQEHLEKSGIRSNLDSLANILTRQIADHYNFSDMVLTEDMSQLFGSMEQIVGEYKRLGLDASVQQLGTYLTHGKLGDLREYIFVERAGLLGEIGKSFGPGDWQRDSTPEYLRGRWNQAIHILEEARANPKATELAQQLDTHLRECVEHALGNLEQLSYLQPQQREESAQVLNEFRQILLG